ncbi:MAG: hypothetical protein KDE14_05710 [Rhodobacteraceae bacterium]|nr:hypothetical protein [Paracoccaceae bacterium]
MIDGNPKSLAANFPPPDVPSVWRRISLQWLAAAAVATLSSLTPVQASAQTSAQSSHMDEIASAIARDGRAVVIVEFYLQSPEINGAVNEALNDRQAEIAAARTVLAEDMTSLGLKVEDQFDSLPMVVTRVDSVDTLKKLAQLPLVRAVTLNSRERPVREG